AFAGSEDRLPGVRVRCAAHFEGESRIIVWIAVDAIRAINRDAWYLDAALAENDGIGGDVGAAWYRPLFTIRHPAAARDHKFNRAAARSDGLSSDIDQAVRGGRIIGSRLGLAVICGCAMHQQLVEGAISARDLPGTGQLRQERAWRKADGQSLTAGIRNVNVR